MFNQEMPKSYVPRRFMIRGVISTGIAGTYYEIVQPGSNIMVDWNKDYFKLLAICDNLNERFKNLNSTQE